jgi:hypothetical protein
MLEEQAFSLEALWFLPHGWCGARVPDSEVMLSVEFKHYYIFATKLIAPV